jgi:transmembrane sensor
MPHDDPIREQAAAWAVRAGDPAFEDWEAFTRWLAESPEHAAAYDRVSAAVADAVEMEKTPRIADKDEERGPRQTRRGWFVGAMAASVAGILALGVWQFGDGGRYTVETAPGQLRTVALDDGSKIDLGGGTSVVLDRNDARFARLEEGQALFTIRHDGAHPFRVSVGDATLVDAGTVFDVRTDSAGMRVAVSEGSVIFNPKAEGVVLNPGDMLAHEPGSAKYVVSRVPVEQVGEWREGRLTFREASLAEIARRISRATGVAYKAAPGSALRSYSGSVLIAPLRDDPQALGPLLGVKVTPVSGEWMIEAL